MRLHLLPLATLAAAFSLSACAPRALYFHESTKVAFAADYNTSDSQPLSSSFGYKRRIVAVVPAQEREIPEGGTERDGTNLGEALSLVSKFNVRSGAKEGVVIINNFASGMAARTLTRSPGSADSLSVLMHTAPIPVSTTTGKTSDEKTAAQAVNERLAKIMSKRIRASDVPRSSGALEYGPDGKLKFKDRATTGSKPDEALPKLPSDEQPKNSRQPASSGTLEYDADGKLRIKNSTPSAPASEKTDKPAVK